MKKIISLETQLCSIAQHRRENNLEFHGIDNSDDGLENTMIRVMHGGGFNSIQFNLFFLIPIQMNNNMQK